MHEWRAKYPIDYSPNGDDIATFAQKVKAEITLIYKLLNVLRREIILLKMSEGETVGVKDTDECECCEAITEEELKDIIEGSFEDGK